MKHFTILFCSLLFMHFAFSQQQITGSVSDASGLPLAGATVSEQGTNNSVSTGTDGTFSISVRSTSSVLVFSYIGLASQEIVVGDRSRLSVVLEMSESHLEEVIVTGYSTQKRGQVTASVATIDSESLKQNATSPRVSNLLQGKVAGVDVTVPTGRPGADPEVRVRGRSSISSQTGALWVVDGVIAHGTPNINPNDIETISILKDGAATTQYGSRGVNGVVVVTTKQAREIGSSTLSANLRTGRSYFNADNFRVMNSQEIWDVFSNFSNPTAVSDIPETVLQNDFDWIENGTQGGQTHDFNLTYTGRTDKAAIYAGGSYYKEEGSVKGYTWERLSGRLNVDYDISERLTFKPKVNVTYTTSDSREHSLYQMYLNLPWDNPYNTDGTVRNPRHAGSGAWYGRDNSNYLYDLQYNYGNSAIFDIQSNLDFEYKISDDFRFVSSNNAAFYTNSSLSYVDPQSDGGLGDRGRIGNSSDRRVVRFTNQMLRYNKVLDRHTINAFAAYEYSDYVYQSLSATGKGIVPGSTIIDASSEPQYIGGTKNDYSFQSIMLQGEYSFDERYNFQGSVRRDGSSRFGHDNRYGTFFAVSGSWNIHNEAFFTSNSIDYLRMRASYGLVGNVPTNYYASYSLFNLNAQYAGIPGGVMGQLGNRSVSWESSRDVNLGFELSIFNRLSLNVDLYNNNTDGLLHFVQLPASAGWSGYFENVGSVRNRGIEIALGGDLFSRNSAFQWRMDVNVAMNRNKITDLYEGNDIPAGNMRRSVGRDIDSWFMRKWAGVDPENGDPLWERIDPTTGEVTLTNNYNQATLQFLDLTGTPNFQGGLSSSMNYKDFYLNAMFAFTEGAWAYNAGRQLFDADGAYPYYNQMALQDGWSRWSPDNPDATHPRLIYNSQNSSNGVSSRYLEDASLIRLRNVTLGYHLPQSFVERLGVKGLDLYLSADNIWSATKFSGLDPEGTLAASTGRDGDATSQYPAPKRFLFGINVSF